jgi:hypothetical protein
MISVVNGYVCTSSCDAVSARAGKDPNAPPGAPPGQSADKSGRKSGVDSQHATVLGGALKDLTATDAVTAANGTAPSNDSQPLLDRLA